MSELSFIDPAGVETLLRRLPGTSGRFMPPVVVNEDVVPGQDGSRLRQVRFGAGQVVVPLSMSGTNEVEYRQRLRDLARSLNPTRGTGVLRSTFAGQVRELHCRYIDGMGLVEQWHLLGQPSLLFRAFDPFWYDTAQTAQTFSPTQASFFPILPLRLSGSEVYADTTVVNDGDVQTWPVFTVTGPGANPVLRNLTSGKALDLTGVTLGAGETVEIDTRPGFKTVRRGDGTNLYGDLTATSSLWPLLEGSNSLRLEMAGTTAQSSFSVRYSRRWLSP